MLSGASAAYLYTDRTGATVGLQSVISDGLDHDYSSRYPALRTILREGTPLEQLHACAVLASWGVRDGLLTVAEWARWPETVPWAGDPVTFDRFFGADDAFALLTDALATTQDVELTEVGTILRVQATRELLVLQPTYYFERSMTTLLNVLPELASRCRVELVWAVEQTIAAARTGPYWMARQAAFLLADLAPLDDERAAAAAVALIAEHPDHEWALKEVALGMGCGSGRATHDVLRRLADWHPSSVRAEAQEHLHRRANR